VQQYRLYERAVAKMQQADIDADVLKHADILRIALGET
jgi:hypothetical protein